MKKRLICTVCKKVRIVYGSEEAIKEIEKNYVCSDCLWPKK